MRRLQALCRQKTRILSESTSQLLHAAPTTKRHSVTRSERVVWLHSCVRLLNAGFFDVRFDKHYTERPNRQGGPKSTQTRRSVAPNEQGACLSRCPSTVRFSSIPNHRESNLGSISPKRSTECTPRFQPERLINRDFQVCAHHDGRLHLASPADTKDGLTSLLSTNGGVMAHGCTEGGSQVHGRRNVRARQGLPRLGRIGWPMAPCRPCRGQEE